MATKRRVAFSYNAIKALRILVLFLFSEKLGEGGENFESYDKS
jgi:hypothetical protein